MTDERTVDALDFHNYGALISQLAESLDLGSGLAAALDVADYAALRSHVAKTLDTSAGLREALKTRPLDRPAHEFGILGVTAIRTNGRMNDYWGRPRERAILAALLLHAGQTVSIDSLIQWAWPDDVPPPRNLTQTFHTYMARLRRSLRLAGSSAQLRAGSGGYRLDVDRSAIDYYHFKTLLVDARSLLRQGRPREAADRALQGIHLWRGRPLADMTSSRADNWRQGVLVNEWLPANTTLLEALVELGEFGDVLTRLDGLQAEHPNDLTLIKLRLASLHRLARHVDATAYYFNARRQLMSVANDRAAEHLRQFHENLREDHSHPGTPARAAGNIVPRQLPADPAHFVGRETLLSAIDAASLTAEGDPTPGIILLEGAAGVGKTSLAVHWAHSARSRFPDGDFFTNLNGFSDRPSATMSTVVDDFLIALGHSPDSSLPQRSRELLLGQLLANRRTLVILDNARDTAHVKDLVGLLSSSLIIVTSRQKLTTLATTTGARRVRVEPMTLDEATALLASRLRGRRHVDDHDREHIARLCGGLPLAITVLAEHVVTHPAHDLSEFAEQLRRRGLVTTDGTGTETLFSWSYERLATPEQRLFRLLGLHPGPDISFDAARAYDGRTRAETKRSLGLLVGAHLLEQPGVQNRYRFHDLLRRFAFRNAERDETPDARKAAERRVISFYLAAATQVHRRLGTSNTTAFGLPLDDAVEPVVFTDSTQAQSWFDQERTNLTASIRAASAHGHHDHAWQLADIVATLFERQGYYANSRTVRELALNSAQLQGNRKAEASALIALGMVHMALGEYTQAQHRLTAGLRFSEDDGSEIGQAAILHQLGRLDITRGAPAAALTSYRQALGILQRVDDHKGLCWTHCWLGEAHRILEQHDLALTHLYRAQSFAQRIGDESAHAKTLIEIGSVHRDLGDLHTATAHCEQALHIVDSMPVPDLVVTTQIRTALAETNLGRNDLNAAVRHAQHAIALSRQTYNLTAEARAHYILGDIQLAEGEHTNALATWQIATELYDRTGMTSHSASVRAKIDKASFSPHE